MLKNRDFKDFIWESYCKVEKNLIGKGPHTMSSSSTTTVVVSLQLEVLARALLQVALKLKPSSLLPLVVEQFKPRHWHWHWQVLRTCHCATGSESSPVLVISSSTLG